MKRFIRFSTSNASDQARAMILSFSAVGIMFIGIIIAVTISFCHKYLDQIQISSVSSPKESFQCLIFNKECHCRISPNETHFSDRCLPRLKLHMLRLLPVVSSVLQLFAFRE